MFTRKGQAFISLGGIYTAAWKKSVFAVWIVLLKLDGSYSVHEQTVAIPRCSLDPRPSVHFYMRGQRLLYTTTEDSLGNGLSISLALQGMLQQGAECQFN